MSREEYDHLELLLKKFILANGYEKDTKISVIRVIEILEGRRKLIEIIKSRV